jgi:hypothetical protein
MANIISKCLYFYFRRKQCYNISLFKTFHKLRRVRQNKLELERVEARDRKYM